MVSVESNRMKREDIQRGAKVREGAMQPVVAINSMVVERARISCVVQTRQIRN
jgi:hypothetical protein